MMQAGNYWSHVPVGLGIAAVLTTLLVILVIRLGWNRKSVIVYAAALMVVMTALCSAAVFTVSSANRTDAQIERISEDYGYIFTASDKTKMRGISPSDVVLNPETADGSIRQVLIRNDGEERIPYVMGDDDEWVRAPLQDAPS